MLLDRQEAAQIEREYRDYMSTLSQSLRKRIDIMRQTYFSHLGCAPQVLRRIMVDEEAAYSVTEVRQADIMSRIIHDKAGGGELEITDGTACVGGNSISFAKTFACVHANEYDRQRSRFLLYNLNLLVHPRLHDRVEVYNHDVTDLEWLKSLGQDILFLDPPWGGRAYKQTAMDSLHLFLSDVDVADFCVSVVKHVRVVALKVPLNFAFTDFMQKTIRVGSSSRHVITNHKNMPAFELIVLVRNK